MKYNKMQEQIIGFSIFLTLTIQTGLHFIEIDFWLYKILLSFLSGLLSFGLIYLIIKNIYFAVWKKRNKHLYLNGEWYHVHISAESESYLRFGTIQIKQNIDELSFVGTNYNINYDKEKNDIEFDYDGVKTNWDGDYLLDLSKGIITGMYSSTRQKKSATRSTKGIHQFNLKAAVKNEILKFDGSFNNIEKAATPKCGSIYIFKDKIEAEQFILDNCQTQLEHSTKVIRK